MENTKPLAIDFSRFAFCESSDVVSNGPAPKKSKSSSTVDDSNSIGKSGKIHRDEWDQPKPIGLKELYTTSQNLERPLKMLIVGHNPSCQSWNKGHYYANPSNRMWPLLANAGIVPSGFRAADDQRCPAECGIGFTDVMCNLAETNSAMVTTASILSNKTAFFRRLTQHIERASLATGIPVEYCYPRVIAFAGVRQWKALFPPNYFLRKKSSIPTDHSQPSVLSHFHSFSRSDTLGHSNGDDNITEKSVQNSYRECSTITGKNRKPHNWENNSNSNSDSADLLSSQSHAQSQSQSPYGIQNDRPDGWPVSLNKSMVYLLPSSSGAAAMTNEERLAPYMALGKLLRDPEYEWESGQGLTCLLGKSKSCIGDKGKHETVDEESAGFANGIVVTTQSFPKLDCSRKRPYKEEESLSAAAGTSENCEQQNFQELLTPVRSSLGTSAEAAIILT